MSKKKDNSRVEGAMETKQWAKVQKPVRVEGRRAISALDCGDGRSRGKKCFLLCHMML